MKYCIGDIWVTVSGDLVTIDAIHTASAYPINAIMHIPNRGNYKHDINYDINGCANYLSKDVKDWNLVKQITFENDPEYFL